MIQFIPHQIKTQESVTSQEQNGNKTSIMLANDFTNDHSNEVERIF